MNDSVTIDSSSEARTLGPGPLDLIASLSAAATRLETARDDARRRYESDDYAAMILSEYEPYAEYGRMEVEDLERRLAVVHRMLREVEGEGLTDSERVSLGTLEHLWCEAGRTKTAAREHIWGDFFRLLAIRKTILYKVERGTEVSESVWEMIEQQQMFIAEAIFDAERSDRETPQQRRDSQRWRRAHVIAEKRKSLGTAPSRKSPVRWRLASTRLRLPRGRQRSRRSPAVRGVPVASTGDKPPPGEPPGPGEPWADITGRPASGYRPTEKAMTHA
jgi:hypothetical protein